MPPTQSTSSDLDDDDVDDDDVDVDDFAAFVVVVDASAIGGLLEREARCACAPPGAEARRGNFAFLNVHACSRATLNENEEEIFEEQWRAKTKGNPKMFNASKFRFANASHGASVGDGAYATKVKVNIALGITDYKTFMCTNLSREWRSLVRDEGLGRERCVVVETRAPLEATTTWDGRYRHLADALGNCVMLHTTDDSFVLLERSACVGEAPGAVVFPGGHAEPSDANVGDEILDVSELMFSSALRECEEELGVKSEDVGDLRMLGITRRVVNARSCMVFYAECRLTADEALAMYPFADDAYESSRAFAVTSSELMTSSEIACRMPGDHVGAVELLRRFLAR